MPHLTLAVEGTSDRAVALRLAKHTGWSVGPIHISGGVGMCTQRGTVRG